MDPETCPKCAEPRFADSLDCPYCGIVYDRYRGAPEHGSPGSPQAAGSPPQPGGGPPAAAGAAKPEEPAGANPATTAPGDVPAPASGAAREAAAVGVETQGLRGATLGMPDVYDGPEMDGLYSPPEEDEGPRGGRSRLAGPEGGPVEVQPTLLNENLGISLLLVLVVAWALYGFWHREMFGVRETLAAAEQDFTRLTGLSPPGRMDEGSSWNLAGYKVVLMEKEGAGEEDFGLTVLMVHPGKFAGNPGQGELLGSVETRLRELGLPFKRTGDRELQVHGSPARVRSWSLEDAEWTYGSASALAFQAPDGKMALLVAAGAPGKVARTMRGVTL